MDAAQGARRGAGPGRYDALLPRWFVVFLHYDMGPGGGWGGGAAVLCRDVGREVEVPSRQSDQLGCPQLPAGGTAIRSQRETAAARSGLLARLWAGCAVDGSQNAHPG